MTSPTAGRAEATRKNRNLDQLDLTLDASGRCDVGPQATNGGGGLPEYPFSRRIAPEPISVARASDPETSHDAAAEVNSRAYTRTLRKRLLLAYAAYPDGLTDEEVCDITNTDYRGRRRCTDLRKMGLTAVATREDGSIVKRPTESGCDAQVARITAKGRQLL